MDPATPQSAAPREKSIWPMFVGTMAMFVIFAVAVQWMLSRGEVDASTEEAQRAAERYEILAKLRAESEAETTGYGWVDRDAGLVRIPLEEAMALAVARLSAQGEPRPAYPVDPLVPLGSALKPGGLAAPQPTPPPFNAPPTTAPEAAAEEADDAAEATGDAPDDETPMEGAES